MWYLLIWSVSVSFWHCSFKLFPKKHKKKKKNKKTSCYKLRQISQKTMLLNIYVLFIIVYLFLAQILAKCKYLSNKHFDLGSSQNLLVCKEWMMMSLICLYCHYFEKQIFLEITYLVFSIVLEFLPLLPLTHIYD